MILWILILWWAMDAPAEFEQHKGQVRFVRAAMQHRTTAAFCGLQSGKSVAGADACNLLLYPWDDPVTGFAWEGLKLPEQVSGKLNPEVWILSKSYTLADQAWNYFKWRVGDRVYSPAECKQLGLQRGDSRTHWLHAGADGMPIRCRVRTAHDPEQLRATGVLLLAWCDEIAHWPELAWQNLQGRGIVTPTRYLITTTPKGKNWLYRDVYLPATHGRDKDTAVLSWSSADNPWADKKYIGELRRKFGKDYAQQELDGLFISYEGYVYAFDRAVHVAEQPVLVGGFDRVVAGVDPGFTDPYAILWMGRADGVWYVLDELYVTKRTTEELIPLILDRQEKYRAEMFWCDKRRPADIRALQLAGLKVCAGLEVYAEDERRTIMPGVRLVQSLLNNGRLYVSEKCENAIDEFENYAYRDVEEKNRGENPVDWKNHAMDALRYALVSEEGIDHKAGRHRYVSASLDGVPAARHARRGLVRMPTVEESLGAQEKRFEKLERVWTRKK